MATHKQREKEKIAIKMTRKGARVRNDSAIEMRHQIQSSTDEGECKPNIAH